LFSSTCLLQYPSPSYIKPLSLHDALPIYKVHPTGKGQHDLALFHVIHHTGTIRIDDARLLRAFASRRAALIVITTAAFALVTFIDRKSTRLNSSHVKISYAVFCLKKKSRI